MARALGTVATTHSETSTCSGGPGLFPARLPAPCHLQVLKEEEKKKKLFGLSLDLVAWGGSGRAALWAEVRLPARLCLFSFVSSCIILFVEPKQLFLASALVVSLLLLFLRKEHSPNFT